MPPPVVFDDRPAGEQGRAEPEDPHADISRLDQERVAVAFLVPFLQRFANKHHWQQAYLDGHPVETLAPALYAISRR